MKKSLSVLGAVLGGAIAVVSAGKATRNIYLNITEDDGFNGTRSAIAHVMGMDTRDVKGYCSDEPGGYTWECRGYTWVPDRSEVADLDSDDPAHREFHTPDTIRENVATSVGNGTGFFVGAGLAVASVLAGLKKKTE